MIVRYEKLFLHFKISQFLRVVWFTFLILELREYASIWITIAIVIVAHYWFIRIIFRIFLTIFCVKSSENWHSEFRSSYFILTNSARLGFSITFTSKFEISRWPIFRPNFSADLNELSTVSRKMSYFASTARPFVKEKEVNVHLNFVRWIMSIPVGALAPPLF